ncbi:MAG TPA: peptidylprolyl isomerase [Caulobacteraceae bacterium]|nr:peptidylprolyl isomerase [Caulobacteraceae bacterium]
MRAAFAAALSACLLAGAAAAQSADWRTPDPENVLVVDTTKGRIIVEMAPEYAPAHVERIKTLTRRGFYDGLTFHRVVDGFMSQTGDPLGTGLGGSELPDLAAEFVFRRAADAFTPLTAEAKNKAGLAGALPLISQPDDAMLFSADGKVKAWGAFCPGVAGMARGGGDVNSANSQFFFMRDAVRTLDQQYTPWGRVLVGLDVVRAIKTGEPVIDPDRMTRVRLLADLPENERPKIRVADPRGAAFKAELDKLKKTRGDAVSICDVTVPVQVS